MSRAVRLACVIWPLFGFALDASLVNRQRIFFGIKYWYSLTAHMCKTVWSLYFKDIMRFQLSWIATHVDLILTLWAEIQWHKIGTWTPIPNICNLSNWTLCWINADPKGLTVYTVLLKINGICGWMRLVPNIQVIPGGHVRWMGGGGHMKETGGGKYCNNIFNKEDICLVGFLD